MRRSWRRWLAGAMTAVMLMSALPTAAYAALWENSADENERILASLTEFWGDERTAQEAMELLLEYGLIDEEGNVLTDWSGDIYLQEESTPLTIAQARDLTEGDVTVNGRACGLSALHAALDSLEALGLLAGNVPAADWQLQVDGADVAPAGLAEALAAWTAPEPEEETGGGDGSAPEDPEGPDVPAGSGSEGPEDPDGSAAEGPEGPADPEESGAEDPEEPDGTTGGTGGGILASALSAVGAALGLTGGEAPAAPAVTVLGQPADAEELESVIAFLDQYGLLTATGAAADWGLTLPGQARKTDLTELLQMLEAGDYDRDMVILVDGTPITMADFQTMMDIQKEAERIRSTYFPEGGVEWTDEELGNLYDLYLQLQENGITLYNTQGADALGAEDFPSGVSRNSTLRVGASPTVANNTLKVDLELETDGDADDVSVSYRVLPGSANIQGTPGTYTFDTSAKPTLSIPLTVGTQTFSSGSGYYYLQFYDLKNAAFPDGSDSYTMRLEWQLQPIHTYVGTVTALGKTASGSDPSDPCNNFERYAWMDMNGVKGGNYQEYINNSDSYNVGLGKPVESMDRNTLTVQAPENLHAGEYEVSLTVDSIFSMPVEIEGGTWTSNTQIQDSHKNFKGILGICDIDEGRADPSLSQTIFNRAEVHYNYTIQKNGAGTTTLFNTMKVLDPRPRVKDDPNKKQDSILSSDVQNIAQGQRDTYSLTLTTSMGYQHYYDRARGIQGDVAWQPYVENTVTLTMQERTSATTVVLSTPDDVEFTSNQKVPIVAVFDFPVKVTADNTITVNGQTLPPQEAGRTTDHISYFYPVPVNDNATLRLDGENLSSITGANDRTLTVTIKNEAGASYGQSGGLPLNYEGDPQGGAQVNIPRLTDALGTWTAVVDDLTYNENDQTTLAQVELSMSIPQDQNFRNLLLQDAYTVDGALYCGVMAGSMDGGKTLIPLTTDNITTPTKLIADLEIDAAQLIDQSQFIMELYELETQDNGDGTVTRTAGDLIWKNYAAFSVNKPVPLTGEDMSIGTPEGWSGAIYVNDPPEDGALTLTPQVDAPEGCTWTQTRWAAECYAPDGETPTETVVATVDENGVIRPLAVGVVKVYLEAVNGGLEDYQGEAYRSEPVVLSIQEGAEPYLRIPESEITLRAGDPLTLRWASNLAQKNAEFGGGSTTFYISICQGKDTDPDTAQLWKRYTATYDPSTPSASLTMGDGSAIPMWTAGEGGALTPNQSFIIPGLDDTGTGYTIAVTASADAGVPSVGGQTYTAVTRVNVAARPVTVSLTRPGSLFVTDQGTLTISYELDNFDAQGGGGEFALTVTDNATGKAVLKTTDADTFGDTTGGSFTLDLESMAPTDGFRTIYDVSLQAKNTTAGQDWSRDSFTLYVYDKSALDILVQPVEKGGITTVGVSGDTVTMSNEAWISSLTQDQILELERDIDLETDISINYKAHAWGEASDRIRWVSGSSGTAAVNYPQGAYYENIESLPYSSYAPATQFLLSGKDDGTTVVQAIHALAGEALSSSVEVTVETLKDKLYLFQFYPAVSGLTMTYTNGDGQQVTKTGDDDGRFAIYEKSGIASDVYVKGESGGEVYLGTVYQDRLVSQEKDAVSLELYPLNSLDLRKVATLPLYLKTPDGRDYDGGATIRVGVYRNGAYCPQARYTLTAGGSATLSGGQDQTVTFQKGKATLYFDVTQFNTSQETAPITAADDIEFVVELRTGDRYYPVLFSAMGTTNEADAIRLGERIISLEEVPAGQAQKPFLARQILYFSDSANGLSTDVRGKRGKVGPSADYPEQLLYTCVMWWGESGTDTAQGTRRSLSYTDDRGNTLTGQKVVNDRYPFASMPITTVTVPMNETQLKHLKMRDLQGRGIQLHYTGREGTQVKQETMAWSFFNALNLEQATQSGSLPQLMDNLALISSGADSSLFKAMVSDFIGAGITLAAQIDIDLPILKLKLAPTGDPTVFRGMVYIGLNNMQDDNVSGVDADTDRDYDVDYFPGMEQLKGLRNQGLKYGKTMVNQVATAGKTLLANARQGSGTSRTGDYKPHYAFNGSFETEVYYDFIDNMWKMVVLSGGFQAGLGLGREWTWNTQVGPVPVFAQLELGGAFLVEFNAAVNRQLMDNDYLTKFYIYAYLQAFGGIGFDYAVIALKLGLFGQIGLDAELEWLNTIQSGNHFGWSVDVKGSVGIKFQIELLFISYEQILWSQPINFYSGKSTNWSYIENYWEEAGKGTSDTGIIQPGTARASLVMAAGDGMGIYAADLEASLLDRDYLSRYDRSYDRSGPDGGFRLFQAIGNFFTGGGDSAISTQVVGNAYPQAAPVLSEDGGWLFYLDDLGEPDDATVVRVNAAARTGQGYDAENARTISDEGYGDSGLKAAGSSENAVAVWSRVTERPATTEAGASVTADVQAGMMNSSEIVAAVRSGSGWKVSYLTGNKNEDGSFASSDGLADLAPVVATNGSRILVAWRQVASSEATAITTFDTKDYIMYAVSEDGGETWTQPQPIYNGTSGGVKGIEAAMLESGEAAVVFTLQTGAHDAASGDFRQEVVYAIVDETPEGYGVTRYVQMTDNTAMDENPQITAVRLEEGDREEVFVIGWSSTSGTDEAQEKDIQLAAVDGDGNRLTGFVDSLSSLIANTGVRVNANFRFSRSADTLDQLSILWKESSVTVEEDESQSENAVPANYDYLSGLRFRTDGGSISVTAAQRIAQMEDSTAIDSFDAYLAGDGRLISVLQGTWYDYEHPETITMNPNTRAAYSVLLPAEKTGIYLGAGSYTDTLRVDSVIPDYEHVRKGMSIPVQISLTNLGTGPMDRVEVTIGNSQRTFEAGGDSGFTAIAPGETRTLTVSYTVPASGIVDPAYSITGTFRSGASSRAEDTLTLNVPDLGIAGSETLLAAENGQRVLQFTLYNNSDSQLAGSRRNVKFNLYSDPECTQPIPAQYFQEIAALAEDGVEALKTIGTDEDLAKIDEGYYTVQYRFDLAAYIRQTDEEGNTPYADENGEVRDGGITLYAKAWVEATDENGTGELLECVSSNNTVSIQLQSLLKQAEGQHVTVTQQLVRNQAGGTDVVVTLNNNSIVRSESGNVVVRLYDARGNVIAAQQSYAPGGELIALDPEERRTLTFSFTQPGVRAEVVYGDLVLDSSDATLAALTLSGLATLADFVLQADGSCAASVEASRTSTTVTAMTADPNAAVTVNGQPLPLEGLTVALVQGENVLTIEVTAQDGTKTVYVLTVQNSYPSSGGSSNVSYPVSAAEDTEHGTFTVRPDRAVTGAVVTITAVPDEGYKVGAVTVTRTNGGAVAVTSEGGGVYTFVMPRSGVTVEVTFVPEDAWVNPFADVPAGAWYYDAVQYVSEHGLMAGTGGGLFSPDATLTRAMLVQILWAMEGRPQVNYLMQYGDVAQDAWYAEAVRWAAGIGIVTGYSDSAFGPSDPLTRQQLALILYGYARHKGYDLTARADLEGYADLDQAAPYALEALKWAVAKGLISGTGDAALSPGGSATRAQVAVILTRFCQNLAG